MVAQMKGPDLHPGVGLFFRSFRIEAVHTVVVVGHLFDQLRTVRRVPDVELAIRR